MTASPDLDRRVSDWLQESAPPRAPEGTLAGVLGRVTNLDQEHHLTQRVFGDGLGRSGRLRWGLALGLVATAGLAGAIIAAGTLQPPSPIPRGELSNGRVAYSIGGDIHVAGNGAADQSVIGHDGDGVEQICPVFSPDGGSLAHIETVELRPEGSPWNLVLTGAAAASRPGGAAIRIPIQPSPDRCPRWAPDGRRLATLEAGTQTELVVIDLDGTATVRFRRDDPGPGESQSGPFQEGRVAWSPDGSTVALVRGYSPGTSDVWLIPVDAGEPRMLIAGAPDSEVFRSIAWAPDGSRVAVWGHVGPPVPAGETAPARTHFIRLLTVDGATEATELDRWTEAENVVSSGPAWSPDGSRLAYVRNGRIVVVSADGTDARELPPVRFEPDPSDDAVTWDIDGTWWPGALSWSPDGRRLLALGTDVPFLERGVRSALVSVDADGSGPPIVLTRWRADYYADREPAWQPVAASVPAWGPHAAGVDDPSPLERTGPAGPTPTPTLPPQPLPQPE